MVKKKDEYFLNFYLFLIDEKGWDELQGSPSHATIGNFFLIKFLTKKKDILRIEC